MEPGNKTERLQVTLPASTVKMIDDIRSRGHFKSRSGFLNEAARVFAIRLKKAELKRKLKAGYRKRANRDRELTREWDAVNAEFLWESEAPDNSN